METLSNDCNNLPSLLLNISLIIDMYFFPSIELQSSNTLLFQCISTHQGCSIKHNVMLKLFMAMFVFILMKQLLFSMVAYETINMNKQT